jgi:hypothetical protein
MSQRGPFDQAAYERRTRAGPCLVCAIANNDPDYRAANVMVYEDARVLVFLTLDSRPDEAALERAAAAPERR